VIEEDPTTATALCGDEIPVIRGAVDDVETFRALEVDRARMVVLNRDDLTNTNVALTVRESSPDLQLTSIAEHDHSVDTLELGGCSNVLHLKRRSGEQLANRVCAASRRSTSSPPTGTCSSASSRSTEPGSGEDTRGVPPPGDRRRQCGRRVGPRGNAPSPTGDRPDRARGTGRPGIRARNIPMRFSNPTPMSPPRSTHSPTVWWSGPRPTAT